MPTQHVLAIRLNPETQQRALDALKWGLIPNWAKDHEVGYKTISAMTETVDTVPESKTTLDYLVKLERGLGARS